MLMTCLCNVQNPNSCQKVGRESSIVCAGAVLSAVLFYVYRHCFSAVPSQYKSFM